VHRQGTVTVLSGTAPEQGAPKSAGSAADEAELRRIDWRFLLLAARLGRWASPAAATRRSSRASCGQRRCGPRCGAGLGALRQPGHHPHEWAGPADARASCARVAGSSSCGPTPASPPTAEPPRRAGFRESRSGGWSRRRALPVHAPRRRTRASGDGGTGSGRRLVRSGGPRRRAHRAGRTFAKDVFVLATSPGGPAPSERDPRLHGLGCAVDAAVRPVAPRHRALRAPGCRTGHRGRQDPAEPRGGTFAPARVRGPRAVRCDGRGRRTPPPRCSMWWLATTRSSCSPGAAGCRSIGAGCATTRPRRSKPRCAGSTVSQCGRPPCPTGTVAPSGRSTAARAIAEVGGVRQRQRTELLQRSWPILAPLRTTPLRWSSSTAT